MTTTPKDKLKTWMALLPPTTGWQPEQPGLIPQHVYLESLDMMSRLASATMKRPAK